MKGWRNRFLRRSAENRPSLARMVLCGLALLALDKGASAVEAATVTATVRYQAQLTLSCSSNACSGSFPVVGDKRRVNVSRMSCIISSVADGSEFRTGQIMVKRSDSSVILNQWLTGVLSSSDGFHTLNQAVDIQVLATQHMEVLLRLAVGSAASAICTATGVTERLQ